MIEVILITLLIVFAIGLVLFIISWLLPWIDNRSDSPYDFLEDSTMPYTKTQFEEKVGNTSLSFPEESRCRDLVRKINKALASQAKHELGGEPLKVSYLFLLALYTPRVRDEAMKRFQETGWSIISVSIFYVSMKPPASDPPKEKTDNEPSDETL